LNPRGRVAHRLSRPVSCVSGERVSCGKVNYGGGPPPRDNELISEFAGWLMRRVTRETAEYYAGVVGRGGWPPQKRAHKKAWRAYVKFLSMKGLIDPLKKMAYLDALELGRYDPTKQTQALVPDAEVLKVKEILYGLGLTEVFVIGLGGARLKHIIKMLTEWEPDEVVEHPHGLYEPRLHCDNGVCRYYLGITSGRKKCHYVYFPATEVTPVNEDPRKLYQRIRDALENRAKFNVLRKWAEQRLTQVAFTNNIPMDAVKLIMTRGLSVSGTHYLNTRDWADKLFELYVREVVKPLLKGEA